MKNKGYVKFWGGGWEGGANKVYYGRCANGECGNVRLRFVGVTRNSCFDFFPFRVA